MFGKLGQRCSLKREEALVNTAQAAGALLIIGSVVFLVGAAVGVPRVFTERDPQACLRMLEEGLRIWRLAQPLYGLGPLNHLGGSRLSRCRCASRMDPCTVRGRLLGTRDRCSGVVMVPVPARHPDRSRCQTGVVIGLPFGEVPGTAGGSRSRARCGPPLVVMPHIRA